MGELNLDRVNSQLSRVSIREKKGNLYLRGQFPEHGQMVRREMALKIKATKEGLSIALGKAKEIDAQLMLGKWEAVQREKLTVAKAVEQYEIDYWNRHEKTLDRLESWKKYQYGCCFKYLPEDEVFNSVLLLKAVCYFPSGSFMQKNFCSLIRPLAKFHKVEFDFRPYMTYQKPELNFRELPTVEMIVQAYKEEKYFPHKWGLGVLATFGLRPHELYKSEFNFESEPQLVYVGEKTKRKKPRTVFPLKIDGLDFLEIPIQIDKLKARCKGVTNLQVGHTVNKWFQKYPFSPYQLRHFYAVRGAMEGIGPVFMSKWMGHDITIHYKHYGSLLGDRESEQLWKQKFTES